MRAPAELTVRGGSDPARAGTHSCEPPRLSSVTREQLAHVLRAASRIAEVRDVVVIGSQSVLGTFADEVLPEEVIGSIEVDVAFLDDPASEKSDKVDGAIGELSQFHETYQYYAQGVSTSNGSPRSRLGRPACGVRERKYEARTGALSRSPRLRCSQARCRPREGLRVRRCSTPRRTGARGHNHRTDRGPPDPVQPEAAPLQLGAGESRKGIGRLASSAVWLTRLVAFSRLSKITLKGAIKRSTIRTHEGLAAVPFANGPCPEFRSSYCLDHGCSLLDPW